jgi:hypothetical protein
MPVISRSLSSLFTAIPAMLWLVMLNLVDSGEYFWIVYLNVCVAFVAISLLLGFIAPSLLIKTPLRGPLTWVFVQGGMAWLGAIILLGLLNLTPLCVGQDNGDGNNNLALCVFQSVAVGIAYLPLELIMLVGSAVIGGWVISKTLDGN